MKIHTYPLGQMRANCYLVEKEDHCLIIDPADDASFILEKIQERRLKIAGMIATHGHFDHILAVGEMQISYKKIIGKDLPLIIHPKDKFLLKRVVETARHFLNYEPAVIPIESTKNIKEGRFQISDFGFQIIHTPGHTPGSICLYFSDENVLFTGDTLFKMGIGRYDFSYSDKDDLRKSIEKIMKLPDDVVIYPGHGEESTIGEERENVKLFF
ncbi:hypothetical protein A3A93_03450 [Candidatus Roizmanbacteria bacterium RIFCSPLOWO2_01_FULL_38_12]|uniref:Metallo-beta-lactamase domain-containing protein n=1 Tax=Candidatus Roizmanbacteria bacterium RIFCSPLOWO2_01_FULL_38_12 TaxID=1802061 RepID=A0A1F7ISP7_9BACT|nr:MAG: hypothetical protein A2861_01330 [Candidatus Roizmanbacteria bacterium RIFCSPHIGHO2_01_FULL_38_15]OGK35825.1 MAG: hypothetical protein A3F59_03735 [Candidatus Roizmanbacteria bacterium RIFCSPHIGHO2_12_FULL_38_13]OGK46397.1 MAG: hypothetical protein A3A93_03450 [Candidatus Roizmanbacteria bacterium RIFCSPLOWO2_01_FULL_38_12]